MSKINTNQDTKAIDETKNISSCSTDKLLELIIELQGLAQAGLHYGKDAFDLERYERIRDISAHMLSICSDEPVEKIKGLFCNETGYQTPKLDSRAAIFNGQGKILLVHENNGTWSLPGGWVDVTLSVYENIVKEVKEEAGLHVLPQRVIAVMDREKHNKPRYAFRICKIFILCREQGGGFIPNIETTGYDYFSMSDLPTLAEEKVCREQLQMCFDAYSSDHWETYFD
ncbi:NUDIX hydrolase [Murimonas intestini]|uniref:NUDIX hydrolase n=1 Tax=Murimonas intestini TaxID=1337051 RepID=UPI0011DE21A6|nr:NUDIX hydrolase [Murimonas intestini]